MLMPGRAQSTPTKQLWHVIWPPGWLLYVPCWQMQSTSEVDPRDAVVDPAGHRWHAVALSALVVGL